MKKWIFLKSTRNGLLKNVQYGISRHLGSQEIQKTKVANVLRDALYAWFHLSVLLWIGFSSSSIATVRFISTGTKGGCSTLIGGTVWSSTSASVNTSPWIKFTLEQDPDNEQDLDSGKVWVGGTRFWHLFGGIGGGMGGDDGVDVVANRVGVLVITESLAWYCLDSEELFSSFRTILSNLLVRFLLHLWFSCRPLLDQRLPSTLWVKYLRDFACLHQDCEVLPLPCAVLNTVSSAPKSEWRV